MSEDDDRQAIEALHRRDVEACLAGDAATRRALFTEDAVLMPPGGAVIRGAAALDASFAAESADEHPALLEYRMDFEELEILGDTAVEWGTISGAVQGADGPVHAEYRVMRVLKRVAGEWLIHRVIWNAEATG